jgi:hypothetical protein
MIATPKPLRFARINLRERVREPFHTHARGRMLSKCEETRVAARQRMYANLGAFVMQYCYAIRPPNLLPSETTLTGFEPVLPP